MIAKRFNYGFAGNKQCIFELRRGQRPHRCKSLCEERGDCIPIDEMDITRTFQNIELFKGMTVLDNLLLGRYELDVNDDKLAGGN